MYDEDVKLSDLTIVRNKIMFQNRDLNSYVLKNDANWEIWNKTNSIVTNMEERIVDDETIRGFYNIQES